MHTHCCFFTFLLNIQEGIHRLTLIYVHCLHHWWLLHLCTIYLCTSHLSIFKLLSISLGILFVYLIHQIFKFVVLSQTFKLLLLHVVILLRSSSSQILVGCFLSQLLQALCNRNVVLLHLLLHINLICHFTTHDRCWLPHRIFWFYLSKIRVHMWLFLI